jgi:hypothetical protein
MYRKAEKRSGCNKKPGLLERVAIKLGVERVAHAQIGCNDEGCLGCYEKLFEEMCMGACEGGGMFTDPVGGGAICNQGTHLIGPSCGVNDGCGCNVDTCTNATQCHC